MLKGGDGRPLGPGLQKNLCTHKSVMLQPSELLICSHCGEIRLRQAAKERKFQTVRVLGFIGKGISWYKTVLPVRSLIRFCLMLPVRLER